MALLKVISLQKLLNKLEVLNLKVQQKLLELDYQRMKIFLLEVLGTKPGTTYNAAQIYGIRQLLEAGAARMRYLASKAADLDNASNVDIVKFRQHYALMAQIQKVLIGVKTETGRALNQFKIASDASKKYSF